MQISSDQSIFLSIYILFVVLSTSYAVAVIASWSIRQERSSFYPGHTIPIISVYESLRKFTIIVCGCALSSIFIVLLQKNPANDGITRAFLTACFSLFIYWAARRIIVLWRSVLLLLRSRFYRFLAILYVYISYLSVVVALYFVGLLTWKTANGDIWNRFLFIVTIFMTAFWLFATFLSVLRRPTDHEVTISWLNSQVKNFTKIDFVLQVVGSASLLVVSSILLKNTILLRDGRQILQWSQMPAIILGSLLVALIPLLVYWTPLGKNKLKYGFTFGVPEFKKNVVLRAGVSMILLGACLYLVTVDARSNVLLYFTLVFVALVIQSKRDDVDSGEEQLDIVQTNEFEHVLALSSLVVNCFWLFLSLKNDNFEDFSGLALIALSLFAASTILSLVYGLRIVKRNEPDES